VTSLLVLCHPERLLFTDGIYQLEFISGQGYYHTSPSKKDKLAISAVKRCNTVQHAGMQLPAIGTTTVAILQQYYLFAMFCLFAINYYRTFCNTVIVSNVLGVNKKLKRQHHLLLLNQNQMIVFDYQKIKYLIIPWSPCIASVQTIKTEKAK
jgi:hypothetical protein